MDFTLNQYQKLLHALREANYTFLTVEQYARAVQQSTRPIPHSVILRHDVDRRADYALKIAQIEALEGIQATFYFRTVPMSNRPPIVRNIAALGHEIGYHYEDLSLMHGDRNKAYKSFQKHLAYFRLFYPVTTICMHGAPTSQYDGRDIWKDFDYHTLGIIAEPYLDFDYAHLFYLTDTGRQWDGFKVSLRDTIPAYYQQWVRDGLTFHSTPDIIRALENGTLPRLAPHILITTHPQRWTNNKIAWLQEAILQPSKNIIKRVLKRFRSTH